jgi:hypothetical protein
LRGSRKSGRRARSQRSQRLGAPRSPPRGRGRGIGVRRV